MSKTKKEDNYLDYIPKHNSLFPYRENDRGNIEVKMKNSGIIKTLTQLLIRKPKYTYIELDEFGSFVWKQIDGEKSIYEIGQLVKEKYGKKAEPLYERLTEYINILRRNRFIVYVNLIKKQI